MSGRPSRRLKAVAALADGATFKAAAELAGVNERTVRRWMDDPEFAATLTLEQSRLEARLRSAMLATAAEQKARAASSVRPTVARKVYIAADPAARAIKIGKASRPEDRVAVLQTGNPHRIRLMYSADCENATEVESLLHRRVASSRRLGEWFSADSICGGAAELSGWNICVMAAAIVRSELEPLVCVITEHVNQAV